MEQGNTHLMANELVFIDLSSIAHPIWHMSASEPDPNHASQAIVARVRALANGHKHVAICCDSGRSFRKDIADSYKANRPPAEAMLNHQIDLAREQLEADGFPVWAVKGFEADDLIASAVKQAVGDGAPAERTALVVSADKDLLQLVCSRVRVMSPRDGAVLDAEAVKAKFGVRPDQIRDCLTLVGDSSDNIKGANKVGPKTAADLLTKYDTLEGIYAALDQHGTQFTPGLATNLREFQPRLVTTRELVTLRFDVPVSFDEVFVERVPKEAATFQPEFDTESEDVDLEAPGGASIPPAMPASSPSVPNGGDSGQPTALSLVPRDADAVVGEPVTDYERQLDPRSMKDARILAKDMHDSRLFSAYGTPQGVLSTVMLGRELGLPAMASLRSIHIIEGKHALSAQLMVALVLKSGLAEYFEPVEFDATHAIFETKRKGARKPVTVEHTIQMAVVAGLVKDKSNWQKVPTDMLVARAQSRLCRLVYPDIVGGLYTPDELAELREQVA